MLKIKFDRLDYQEKAVDGISDVFKNINFIANENRKSNPSFELYSQIKHKMVMHYIQQPSYLQ